MPQITTTQYKDPQLKVFTDLDNMRENAQPGASNSLSILSGLATAFDADGGLYVWNADSADADNGTTIIKPSDVTGNGRYIRCVSGGGGGGTLVDPNGSIVGNVGDHYAGVTGQWTKTSGMGTDTGWTPDSIASFFTAAAFNGVDNYLYRNSDFTDSWTFIAGTVSFWIKGPNQTGPMIIAPLTTPNGVGITTFCGGDTFGMEIIPPGNGLNSVFDALGVGTVLDNTWHHVMFSWDDGDALDGMLYVDDASVPFTRGPGYTFPTVVDAWSIGLDISAPEQIPFEGCLAQIYMNNIKLDLSDVAVRRKFITAGLDPVYLGSAGQFVTGSFPNPAFLPTWVDANVWGSGLNNGAHADNFTPQGTFSDCSNPVP